MTHTIDWVGGVPEGQYLVGREGNPVVGVVDHWIGMGTLESAVRYFQTLRPDPTSAHFIVGRDGTIVQMVHMEDTAFHAGDYGTNLRTVGVEHEVTPTLLPTAALYAASAWLHKHIADRYGLDLATAVVRHSIVLPTACPGTLDVQRVIAEAEEDTFTEEDRAVLRHIQQRLDAVESLVWLSRLQRSLDVENGRPFDPRATPLDPRVLPVT